MVRKSFYLQLFRCICVLDIKKGAVKHHFFTSSHQPVNAKYTIQFQIEMYAIYAQTLYL